MFRELLFQSFTDEQFPPDKLKFIFCSHSIQHTNDWVSFIFPQVSKLIIQKENNEQKTQVIKGFTTNANIQKYFLTPIPMDVTTDFLACKILTLLHYRLTIAKSSTDATLLLSNHAKSMWFSIRKRILKSWLIQMGQLPLME